MGQTLFVRVVFWVFGQLLGDSQVSQGDVACLEVGGQGLELLVDPGDPVVGGQVAQDVVEDLPAGVGRQLAPVPAHNVQTLQLLILDQLTFVRSQSRHYFCTSKVMFRFHFMLV